MNKTKPENDKPAILNAIEIILTKPEDIKKETISLKNQYYNKYKEKKTNDSIDDLIAKKIISNYSYYSAFVGGATGVTGIVPGIGTAIATFGGATGDVAMTMKYQIEMTMALATLYGHNIEDEEEKRICLIVAGLCVTNETAKEGAKQLGSKALVKVTKEYLKKSSLVAIKEIFKKVGINFTRSAVQKVIPFGVGVIIGFSANKGLTWIVGNNAKAFFKAELEE